MSQKFWRLQQVQDETGLSRSGIYEGMADGTFPRCFKISERCVAWYECEVQQWKAAKLVAAGRKLEAA